MFTYCISSVFRRVPVSLLENLELKIQEALGKGWGSATTDKEAKIICDLAKNIISDEIIVLDIGANVGNWSASIKKYLPNCRIFAFEPSAQAFEKVSTRFRNWEKFSCENLAIGKDNIETFLYADVSASGLGSLTKRRVEHLGLSFDHSEPVKLATLDTWCLSQSPKVFPNIIKMDVEGHELDVLMGAVQILESVEVIQFEFGGSNIDTKTYFQDFWYFFKSNGFKIYRITPKGLKLIPEYSETHETFRPTNYIAVRKE